MVSMNDREFRQLAEYIYKSYGIDLFHKKTLVEGRLQSFLAQNNLGSFREYYDYLLSDVSGKAKSVLIDRVTTNHTFFMRESEHFEYFKNHVLPYLAAVQRDKQDLRVWSSGCSTGEEPYTLAMIIADYFGQNKGRWDTRILATDISTRVLEKAVAGRYARDSVRRLPERWRKNYFRHENGEYVVDERIKREVIFRRFNLNKGTFPFKRKFHAIFCRNVMIYFDMKTRRELVDRFYEFTEPGGYLFVGHSESINRSETRYRYVMPAVYRKE